MNWLCRAVSPLSATGAVSAPPPDLWPPIIALADEHLLLPELKLAFDRHGLAAVAPADLTAVLDDLYDLNKERNGLLRAQMLELTQAFAAVGVAPIWLKGATELLEPDWERSGRMMNDLDLWIPDPAGQAAALAQLDALGYGLLPGPEEPDWLDSHHYAPRVNDVWPARVELHRCVIDPGRQSLLPDAAALSGVVWLEWRGFRVGRLSPRHRVLHALVQATAMAVPPFRTGRTPLMKGLDVARRLAADFDGRLPDDLRDDLARPVWDGLAAPFLTMTENLFGLPNPLAADAIALRRLATVTAFPRLDYLREFVGALFSRRLAARLLNPTTIPAILRRWRRLLIVGRDMDA